MDLLVYVLLIISIKIMDFDSWDLENMSDFVKKCGVFVISNLINKEYWLFKVWNLFKVEVSCYVWNYVYDMFWSMWNLKETFVIVSHYETKI